MAVPAGMHNRLDAIAVAERQAVKTDQLTKKVGRRRLQAFHVVGHITCYVVDASRAASSGAVMEGGTQSTRLGSMELCPLPIGMDNDLRVPLDLDAPVASTGTHRSYALINTGANYPPLDTEACRC
eukprot:g32117.t1